MMHEEFVSRRGWLTESEFLDLVAAANFIPGPNSTEVAIHIGYRRGGMKGLVVAGSCFILPAAILCTLIAAAYVRYGHLPVTEKILYGIKPVVIAIVCQALVKLAKTMVKSKLLLAVALLAAMVNFWLGHELLVLFGAGAVVLAARFQRRRGGLMGLAPLPLGMTMPATTAAVATTAGVVTVAPIWSVFLAFLKIGSVLFGSGYVLLAFLQADLVERYGWLTQKQLLDAVAVGQFTPGPVFTTATFIGYVMRGPQGALAATLGIFLPAFFFVAVTAPILPWLRKSKNAGYFLDGLNAGSLALMGVVTVELAKGTLVDPLTWVLAAASLGILLWRKGINSAWLIVAGGVVGVAMGYR
jgi:chromate transporter